MNFCSDNYQNHLASPNKNTQLASNTVERLQSANIYYRVGYTSSQSSLSAGVRQLLWSSKCGHRRTPLSQSYAMFECFPFPPLIHSSPVYEVGNGSIKIELAITHTHVCVYVWCSCCGKRWCQDGSWAQQSSRFSVSQDIRLTEKQWKRQTNKHFQ